jgi:hypothetical protein
VLAGNHHPCHATRPFAPPSNAARGGSDMVVRRAALAQQGASAVAEQR